MCFGQRPLTIFYYRHKSWLWQKKKYFNKTSMVNLGGKSEGCQKITPKNKNKKHTLVKNYSIKKKKKSENCFYISNLFIFLILWFWPSSCFNMQAWYQIPIGNTFILKWDRGYQSITTNYSMYILDKIFIHVNNEIYTGVINLCVGDRRSRYNNCYRLSFSDNNKLAIKKIVTM